MYDVFVDHQLLTTPQGNPFQVPTLSLAKAIKEEWKKAPELHYQRKPLTSLAATALDRIAPEKEVYIQDILAMISKDLLFFWETKPASLVKLQEEKWAPVLEEVNKILNLHLGSRTSLVIQPLAPEDEIRVKTFLLGQSHFKLAALSHLLTLTSSFCLACIVMENRLSPEKAWDLAHLHEHYQRFKWGEDPDALAQEERQRAEFLETVRFIRLL
jgi:chaperone required for assembly of F1-ATPase